MLHPVVSRIPEVTGARVLRARPPACPPAAVLRGRYAEARRLNVMGNLPSLPGSS